MVEFSEEQELHEIRLDEADDEGYAIEEIGENLEYLRDSSDNLNLYLAFKAYHEDRDFEEAVEKFEAAIAYEREHGVSAEVGASGERIPNATLVKCLYWLGESHYKIEQREEAVEIFEALAGEFGDHYLGLAARRRLERLSVEAQPLGH